MSCDETLKKNGLKLTPQRRLIVETIHTSGLLTAEEIVSQVQSRMPGINKSTIYRTLDLLERTGCIFKSELGEQAIYHHPDGGHHYHLVCSECGHSVDCDETLFTQLEASLIDKYSFSLDVKHLVINGLCRECREKARA